MISGIVCVAKDWAIGKTNKETGKGELLFNIPEDMKFFKEKTNNRIVVFGENTYLSLPKRPLKNRLNVVLCPEGHEYEDCKSEHDFDAMVRCLQNMSALGYEIFICGGAMLYKSFMDLYDRVYVTYVDAIDKEATAFFPNIDENKNFILDKDNIIKSNSNNYNIEFRIYNRIKGD